MIDKFGEPTEPVKLTRLLIAHEQRIVALEELVKVLCVDRGVDWVGQVVRERMLADLHTRELREAAPKRPRTH